MSAAPYHFGSCYALVCVQGSMLEGVENRAVQSSRTNLILTNHFETSRGLLGLV